MVDHPLGIRLVLSDMDGTILDSDRDISARTLAAVKRLRQAHIPLALVSARAPAGVLPYVRKLGLEGPCAGFNGGVFFTPDGTILSSHHFSVEILHSIMAALATEQVEIWFQNEASWFVCDTQTPLALREHEVTGVIPQQVDALPIHSGSINRLIVSSEDIDLIARLEKVLGARFCDGASILRSAPHKLNITPFQATKGEAVRVLAGFYGVDSAQVAVLGDAPNDIPMLSVAGLGIAMGQAPDSVKKQARCVTKTPDEGGWAYAVDTFIMPTKKPASQG